MNKKITTRICERVLYFMAWCVLRRQKPFIIAVTGSVGKTTTKDMIAAVVATEKTVRCTQKNYNTEIGVPLTIFGVGYSVNSMKSMCGVVRAWLASVFTDFYPDVLIVEMGVDRPGDMDYLMNLVQPDVSVLTSVAYAHSEFFASIEDIAQEKQKIVTLMEKKGVAIVNGDDKHVKSVVSHAPVHTMLYGTHKSHDFYASDIDLCFWQCAVTGLSFKLNYDGKVIPVRLQNVCAKHLVYAALASLAVAEILHINVVNAAGTLMDFVTAPGRMRLLEGMNGSLVIDDTYNASPRAMEAAIDTLAEATSTQKIAILGDMRELGKVSQKEHENIAHLLRKHNITHCIFVGEEMKYAYDVLHDTCSASYYMSSLDAVEEARKYAQPEHIILVKGSRGIHMEYIARALVLDDTQTL